MKLLRLLFLIAAALMAALAQAATSIYANTYKWIDDKALPVQLSHWQGKPIILSMEYSNCRFICSITLQRLKDVQAALDRRGQKMDIVVVSIDPANDSPQAWTKYRESRKLDRDNWHFLTGNEADTRQFARQVGVNYWYYHEHLVHDLKIMRISASGEIERSVETYDADMDVLLK